jgi:hypothetical protein
MAKSHKQLANEKLASFRPLINYHLDITIDSATKLDINYDTVCGEIESGVDVNKH